MTSNKNHSFRVQNFKTSGIGLKYMPFMKPRNLYICRAHTKKMMQVCAMLSYKTTTFCIRFEKLQFIAWVVSQIKRTFDSDCYSNHPFVSSNNASDFLTCLLHVAPKYHSPTGVIHSLTRRVLSQTLTLKAQRVVKTFEKHMSATVKHNSPFY